MFSELTFNIIMTMVAGKRYYGDDVSVDKEEVRQLREIMKEVFAHGGAANPADFLPILNWVGSNAYEKRVMKLAKRTEPMRFCKGWLMSTGAGLQRVEMAAQGLIICFLCRSRSLSITLTKLSRGSYWLVQNSIS